MPCINAAQIQRMVTMCGAKFPEKFQKIVHRYGDNKAALLMPECLTARVR